MMRTFIDRHARECAQVLAESWDVWRGDCDICGAVDAYGFCDRCTECAIESYHLNELEHGGTTEHVVSHFGIEYPYDRCPRLVEAVAHLAMDYQANIWRNLARLNGYGVGS